MSTEAQKTALRAQMRAVLRQISPSDRETASRAILQQLVTTPAFQEARTVLLFAALPSEPDLLPLLERYSGQKTFCFPRTTPQGLVLHPIQNIAEFETNGNLREPHAASPTVPASAIDLAILPGLAFDATTNTRMGRGGGYYDRLLAHPEFRAVTIGVCFRLQLHSPLPTEPHDHPVQQVLWA